jgi:hypothetical protein
MGRNYKGDGRLPIANCRGRLFRRQTESQRDSVHQRRFARTLVEMASSRKQLECGYFAPTTGGLPAAGPDEFRQDAGFNPNSEVRTGNSRKVLIDSGSGRGRRGNFAPAGCRRGAHGVTRPTVLGSRPSFRFHCPLRSSGLTGWKPVPPRREITRELGMRPRPKVPAPQANGVAARLRPPLKVPRQPSYGNFTAKPPAWTIFSNLPS